MGRRRVALALFAAAFLFAGTLGAAEKQAAAGKGDLRLTAGQKEFLHQEPILVKVEGPRGLALPAAPGAGKLGTLRFEAEPAVKPRKGGKPLPLEGRVAGAAVRTYDLTEWLAFPEKGTFTIRAVVEQAGATRTSTPITVTIRRPGKGDAEAEAVGRIHHTPWTNYDTNAFCGDTFDVVKRWPGSRLARYCHYWNGRYSQNKKEYDKALASYRTVLKEYPDFALADAAEFGVVECLHAAGKIAEAKRCNEALRKKLQQRSSKAGTGTGTVQELADAMARRLDAAVGLK